MAKAPGRLAVLAKNAVPIAGITELTLKSEATSIDVTDFAAAGVQTLLAQAARRSLTISCKGFVDSAVLRDILCDPAVSPTLTDLTFKFADALVAKDTIGGTFFMTSYEENNPEDQAADFSAEFQSAGLWTLT